MEMYQLKYLVETVHAGGIAKAAESLFVSQPAISQALVRLETELNVQIYIRKEKNFTLTEAGKLVYVYAERIMYDLDSFYREFHKEFREDVLHIVSADAGFKTFLLPLYLMDHPEVTVTNQEAEPDMIQKMTEGSNVDIAITNQDMTGTRLQSVKLMDLSVCVLVPRGNPLAKAERLTFEDLKGQPFIRYKSDSGYMKPHKRQFDSLTEDLNVVYEGNETTWSVMQMKKGNFFFITSYRLLRSDIYPYHKVIPLGEKMFTDTMYATFKRNPKPVVKDFVNSLKEILREISEDNYYCKNGLLKFYI